MKKRIQKKANKGEIKNKIKVAVLGASGFVGRQFVRLLAQHPFFELALITSSEDNVGKKFEEIHLPTPGINDHAGLPPSIDQNLSFERLDSPRLKEEDIGLVFSALPSEIAGPIEDDLRKKGLAVFTNSSAHRMDKDVPIVIPEVNPDHLELIKVQEEKYGGFIVASSNCCVAGLALSLKPLVGWGIKKVRVATYQSISGASPESLPAATIVNNVIPFIANEEEKIGQETAKILGHLVDNQIIPVDLSLMASCVRVPVLFGHLLAVEVEFKTPPVLDEVLASFCQTTGGRKSILQPLDLPTAPRSPIILRSDLDRPQPALDFWAGEPERARGMAITIGRWRVQQNTLRYFLLVNNLVRGAAGNCLLTAELAWQLGYLRRKYSEATSKPKRENL